MRRVSQRIPKAVYQCQQSRSRPTFPPAGSSSLPYLLRLLNCNLRPSGDAGDIAANGHGLVHVDLDLAALALLEALPQLSALSVLVEGRLRSIEGAFPPEGAAM